MNDSPEEAAARAAAHEQLSQVRQLISKLTESEQEKVQKAELAISLLVEAFGSAGLFALSKVGLELNTRI